MNRIYSVKDIPIKYGREISSTGSSFEKRPKPGHYHGTESALTTTTFS